MREDGEVGGERRACMEGVRTVKEYGIQSPVSSGGRREIEETV